MPIWPNVLCQNVAKHTQVTTWHRSFRQIHYNPSVNASAMTCCKLAQMSGGKKYRKVPVRFAPNCRQPTCLRGDDLLLQQYWYKTLFGCSICKTLLLGDEISFSRLSNFLGSCFYSCFIAPSFKRAVLTSKF